MTVDLANTLESLSGTARSISELANYLQRYPKR